MSSPYPIQADFKAKKARKSDTVSDGLGLRQVFQLSERDVGPVFTWTQLNFGSSRSFFHGAPVYPKTRFLALARRYVCYSLK